MSADVKHAQTTADVVVHLKEDEESTAPNATYKLLLPRK